MVLEGVTRHASIHAAGIVIAPKELTEYVPPYKDPKAGTDVTQYSIKYIEDFGLLKMDFLDLRTLTVINNTILLIQQIIPDFSLDSIPSDDRPTFELFGRGETVGIFQFESGGMQKYLKCLNLIR
ncbi:hypothetical protein ACFL4Q_03320 [candidate division KSB1 bacterium]